jgi:hypothetical protein
MAAAGSMTSTTVVGPATTICWCSRTRSRAAASDRARLAGPQFGEFRRRRRELEIRPRIAVGEIRIDEDKSCDRDGFVDAGSEAPSSFRS